ncbi:hypothetical protein ACLEX4_08215 [Pseudescherichia vulneris]
MSGTLKVSNETKMVLWVGLAGRGVDPIQPGEIKDLEYVDNGRIIQIIDNKEDASNAVAMYGSYGS